MHVIKISRFCNWWGLSHSWKYVIHMVFYGDISSMGGFCITHLIQMLATPSNWAMQQILANHRNKWLNCHLYHIHATIPFMHHLGLPHISRMGKWHFEIVEIETSLSNINVLYEKMKHVQFKWIAPWFSLVSFDICRHRVLCVIDDFTSWHSMLQEYEMSLCCFQFLSKSTEQTMYWLIFLIYP